MTPFALIWNRPSQAPRTLGGLGRAAGAVLLAVGCCLAAGCEVKSTQPDAVSAPQAGPRQLPGVPRLAHGRLQFVNGYDQGLAVSRQSGKPLLLFFTAEWCHYCRQMADEAFCDDHVVSLSEKFVCVLVDADSSRELCRQFQVDRFPTIQFVSPQGVVLNCIQGKVAGHVVAIGMQTALQTVARRPESSPARLR